MSEYEPAKGAMVLDMTDAKRCKFYFCRDCKQLSLGGRDKDVIQCVNCWSGNITVGRPGSPKLYELRFGKDWSMLPQFIQLFKEMYGGEEDAVEERKAATK